MSSPDTSTNDDSEYEDDDKDDKDDAVNPPGVVAVVLACSFLFKYDFSSSMVSFVAEGATTISSNSSSSCHHNK